MTYCQFTEPVEGRYKRCPVCGSIGHDRVYNRCGLATVDMRRYDSTEEVRAGLGDVLEGLIRFAGYRCKKDGCNCDGLRKALNVSGSAVAWKAREFVADRLVENAAACGYRLSRWRAKAGLASAIAIYLGKSVTKRTRPL